MNCASCGHRMTAITLERHGGAPVTIDTCGPCHVFWFDKHESLQLTPGSTLQLFAMIGEQPAAERTPLVPVLKCPHCGSGLMTTQDRQRTTPFRYFRCVSGHGRLITFFDFLREKDFIRPLTAVQLAELRKNLKVVNCSNCGAPIDLAVGASCRHCGSPVSMLDLKHAGAVVEQLRKAAKPREIDPALPLELERARRQVELAFAASEAGGGSEWWRDVGASGMVEAGLGAFTRWLRK